MRRLAIPLMLVSIAWLAALPGHGVGATTRDDAAADPTVGVPLHQAAMLACVPSCEVLATQVAFGPPTTVVSSGTRLEWSAVDTYHTATARNPDFSTQRDPCFDARIWPDDNDHVVLTIRIDGLYAKGSQGAEQRCDEAVALPDGSYAIAYQCIVHPTPQRGVLVVTPAS